MKTKILLILIFLISAVTVSEAQNKPDERQSKWRTQLREYKHNYITRALNLSAEQKKEFFLLYDEMDERLETLNNEARDIDRKISGDQKLTDIALDAYSRRLFEQKKLESEIELEYYDKFKAILTSKQLALLKHAETEIIANLNRFYHGRRSPNDTN